MITSSKQLPSHLIELTRNACNCTFWRKDALKLFLRQHRISDSQLASLTENETKRDFLARLFYALIRLPNNEGHRTILDIAYSLAEMEHFPDLENWPDTESKITKARDAISKIRPEVQKLKQAENGIAIAEKRRQQAEEERERNIASQNALQELSNSLQNISTKQGTQEGGYEFENWFYELANFAEIPSRKSYKDSNGRQIDGSITIDGITFLIECKFIKEQVGSQDIDIFLSKIATKADNTMGIMISMSGYNQNAIRNASRDRTPLLLLDFTHIYMLVLPGMMNLKEVVQRVWRHASQTGESFLPVDRFSG